MRAIGRWDSRAGVLAVAVAVVCALPLAFTSRADAYVYWASQHGLSIGRVAEDGSGVNPTFISLISGSTNWAPYGLAVNKWGSPPQILWTWGCPGWIGRVNIDGSNLQPQFLPTGICQFAPVAVNSQYIYWTGAGSKYIGRAKIDGSDANPTFLRMPIYGSATALALDNNHIYWADDWDSIGRANLDGSGIDPEFIYDADMRYLDLRALAVETEPMDIFHPNPFIFWANSYGISTAWAKDGSHIDRGHIPGVPYGSAGMAWSKYDNRLFWSIPSTGAASSTGDIRRSPRDGTPVKTIVSERDADVPGGVAIDGTGPVVASPTGVTVRRQRLRTALRRGVRGMRLRPPGSGRVCVELRLRPRAARLLGLLPRGSEVRLGELVGRRRCLNVTTPRARKPTVRFRHSGRVALRKLLGHSGPRRLARLRRIVRRKGLALRLRIVWTDALGYRHPTRHAVRLVK